jgi:hypothetical protein
MANEEQEPNAWRLSELTFPNMRLSHLAFALSLLFSLAASAPPSRAIPISHVSQARLARPVQAARPFGLPFASPPGPSTWLLGQPYGNTVTAYRWRRAVYEAGQGLHFGAVAMPFGRGFARDLESPRQWQYLDDQPEVRFWQPLLNDYAHPWPLEWNDQ